MNNALAEALRNLIEEIEDELMPNPGDIIAGSLATALSKAKVALRDQ